MTLVKEHRINETFINNGFSSNGKEKNQEFIVNALEKHQDAYLSFQMQKKKFEVGTMASS